MVLLVTAAIVVWLLAWAIGAVGVIRRNDLGGGAKVLWFVVLLVFPIVGLMIWYLWQAANPDRGVRA